MPDTLPANPTVADLLQAPPEIKRAMAEDRVFWALRDIEKLSHKVRELQLVFGARLTPSDRQRITSIKNLLDGAL